MKKFKEIMFLKNLKRVGKSAIYGKYWDILNECQDLDDLLLNLKKIETKFSDEDLLKSKSDAEDFFNFIENSDIHVITIFDENYPEKLEIMGKKRPLILYVRGNLDALSKPNIAVIGTRKPLKLSETFEEELVKNVVNTTNRVVVSGLALGCDKIAHKTTVDEGKTTIAVLPSGLDNVKPATNKKLADEIIQTGGCLVSEYEPDKSVYKSTYVERDQIVAAFSDAIFVVECGIESGTMHTVGFANDYQRQIYTFIPKEIPNCAFDGNEFILNEYHNSIGVENIEEFINDLDTLEINKGIDSIQQTLC